MKFILNENAKFILEERFILAEENILTEGSAETTALTLLQKLKSSFADTEEVLKKFNEYAQLSKGAATTQAKLKTLKTTLDKATDDLENTLNLPTEDITAENSKSAKAELAVYIEALTQIKSVIPTTEENEDLFTLFDKRIENLNKAVTKTDAWSAADIKTITGIFEWITEKIVPFLDTTSFDSKAIDVEEFKKACENCLKLIEDIKTNAPDKAEDFEGSAQADVKAFCVAIKQLLETVKLPAAAKVTKGAVIKNLGVYYTQVQALQKSFEQIQQSPIFKQQLEKHSEAEAKAKAEAEAKARAERTDWAELYRKCASSKSQKEAFRAFWHGGLPLTETEATSLGLPQAPSEKATKGYYECEWGTDSSEWGSDEAVKVIKAFGITFINSLENYGWTPVLNPYIDLLQHLFTIFKANGTKILLNNATFTQIYSAVEKEHLLSSKDIRGKGELGGLNLVRNIAFYTKQPTEIKEYLEFQKKVIDASNVPKEATKQIVYANIVYADSISDWKNPAKKDAFEKLMSAKGQYKEIRPLTEFKEAITEVFKLSPSKNETKSATDAEIDQIIDKIKTPEAAKKLLVYLVNLCRFRNRGALTKLLSDSTIGAKLKQNSTDVSITFEESNTFDSLLNISARTYLDAQIQALVKKLMTKAGMIS